MLFTCVAACGPSGSGCVPNSTGPSNNRIVAVTGISLGLYNPMFVRESPLARLVNTVTAAAAEAGSPGTNIPTWPPSGVGDLNWEVTTSSSKGPLKLNSTAPNVPGEENRLAQMSSNACASRGPS